MRGGFVDGVGGKQVLKGLHGAFIGEIPERCFLMLLFELVRVLLECLQQEVSEQVVIAEPFALLVRSNHEQVGAFQ
ncbi:hypothetical protein D3C76_1510040 [compost metagenome]